MESTGNSLEIPPASITVAVTQGIPARYQVPGARKKSQSGHPGFYDCRNCRADLFFGAICYPMTILLTEGPGD